MNKRSVTFDIRCEAARSLEPWEPLSKVIWMASQLQPDQTLVLLTSFEGLARLIDMDVRVALRQMPGPVELRVLSTGRLGEPHYCPEHEGLVAELVTRADASHFTHIKNPAA